MLPRLAKLLCLLAATLGIGYWLFSDTDAYYSSDVRSQPLRMSFTGTFEEFAMWREILDGFRAQHPEISVKGEYILENGYVNKINQFLVAGNAPDVMVYEDERFPNRVNEGQWEDLTPFLEKTPPLGDTIEKLNKSFWPTAFQSFGRWEGDGPQRRWHMYGLPIKGGCNLLFYNKSCFARARIKVAPLPGPEGLVRDPSGAGWIVDDQRWTLAEWIEVCKLLTIAPASNGQAEQYAFAMPNWKYWLPFSETLEASYLDDEHKHMTFYGPRAEAAFQLMQDLRFKHHVSQTRNEITMSENVGFLTGRIALFTSGPWEIPFFSAAPNLQYDVLHMPRATRDGYRATRVTWDSVVMYGRSRKKEQAWVLMQYLVSAASQKTIGRSQSYVPALREAGPDFIAANASIHGERFIETAGTYARMQPISGYWDLLSRVIQQSADRLVADTDDSRLTPAQAIGMIYDENNPDSRELRQRLPPADPQQADQYVRLYRERKNH